VACTTRGAPLRVHSTKCRHQSNEDVWPRRLEIPLVARHAYAGQTGGLAPGARYSPDDTPSARFVVGVSFSQMVLPVKAKRAPSAPV